MNNVYADAAQSFSDSMDNEEDILPSDKGYGLYKVGDDVYGEIFGTEFNGTIATDYRSGSYMIDLVGMGRKSIMETSIKGKM